MEKGVKMELIEGLDKEERRIIRGFGKIKKNYVGSLVLGLNDGLIEMIGALAGLTLALQNLRIIGISVLIMGVAASLSMAASEYLAIKSEKRYKNALKPAFYTGASYFLVVLLLVSPYFIMEQVYYSLILTLIIALVIIFIFTYYISVKLEKSFTKRFFEMILLSLGVAAISIGVGYLIRIVFDVGV